MPSNGVIRRVLGWFSKNSTGAVNVGLPTTKATVKIGVSEVDAQDAGLDVIPEHKCLRGLRDNMGAFACSGSATLFLRSKSFAISNETHVCCASPLSVIHYEGGDKFSTVRKVHAFITARSESIESTLDDESGLIDYIDFGNTLIIEPKWPYLSKSFVCIHRDKALTKTNRFIRVTKIGAIFFDGQMNNQ